MRLKGYGIRCMSSLTYSDVCYISYDSVLSCLDGICIVWMRRMPLGFGVVFVCRPEGFAEFSYMLVYTEQLMHYIIYCMSAMVFYLI